MNTKPSDIPDHEADAASAEADHISKVLTDALATVTVKDPDSLTTALTVMLINAFVEAGNNTPVQITGAFALCVAEWALRAADKPVDIDQVPALTADMLDFVAARLRAGD